MFDHSFGFPALELCVVLRPLLFPFAIQALHLSVKFCLMVLEARSLLEQNLITLVHILRQ